MNDNVSNGSPEYRDPNLVRPIEPATPKKKSSLLELLKFAIIAAIIVIPIRMFIAQPFVVSGSSMVPTFHDKEYLIVDEISYHMRDPHRGEVIVFRYPNDPSKFFIKRVIGLPGDTIKIKDGSIVVINDQYPEGLLLDEPYIKNKSSDSFETELHADEYFVMGDNRVASSDSRIWGALPRNYVVGRALVRILPLSEASLLPGYYLQQ